MWYLKKFISDWRVRRKIPRMPTNSVIDMDYLIVGGGFMKIGERTYVGRFTILTAWSFDDAHKPTIEIGNDVNIGEYNHITASNKIVIGDGVLTGRWVTISDNNHGSFTLNQLQQRPLKRPVVSKGDVVIGRNVWIGDKATILSGVHIGEGSIIGANSVVTKNVPPYSLAVGNPAKVVKSL